MITLKMFVAMMDIDVEEFLLQLTNGFIKLLACLRAEGQGTFFSPMLVSYKYTSIIRS